MNETEISAKIIAKLSKYTVLFNLLKDKAVQNEMNYESFKPILEELQEETADEIIQVFKQTQ